MIECPSCGKVETIKLVEGIWQCPKCKKIIKEKKEEKIIVEDEHIFISGETFMKTSGLNKKYEICEKGVYIDKTPKNAIASLICHSTYLPSSKYIRISWFKGLSNSHSGMIKITEPAELANVIKILEIINKDFDENFNKITKKEEIQISDGEIIEFKFKDNKCPKCSLKMKKSRNARYYSCESCGEIVILEDGRPIFDFPTDKLPLNYSNNFPINYYIPERGVTFKWLMGEWKAVIIIYNKTNPDKKFLRFYWWTRNLQDYIKSEFSSGGSSRSLLGWVARKGVGMTNIYDKDLIVPLIQALKMEKEELNW